MKFFDRIDCAVARICKNIQYFCFGGQRKHLQDSAEDHNCVQR
jgi:hypothetical protein